MDGMTDEPTTGTGQELALWMRGYGLAEYRVRMIRAVESEAVDKFKASLIGVSTIVPLASYRRLVADSEAFASQLAPCCPHTVTQHRASLFSVNRVRCMELGCPCGSAGSEVTK
jgi:hypothetical protein